MKNKPVIVGTEWPGLGIQVNVRVKVKGEYGYTTIIWKQDQRLVDRVKETRRKFRKDKAA